MRVLILLLIVGLVCGLSFDMVVEKCQYGNFTEVPCPTWCSVEKASHHPCRHIDAPLLPKDKGRAIYTKTRILWLFKSYIDE